MQMRAKKETKATTGRETRKKERRTEEKAVGKEVTANEGLFRTHT
jgi:hypothetical protein